MTPEEHNKALGICHLAYGGLSTLLMLAFMFMFGAILFAIPEGGPPFGIMVIFAVFMLIYSFIFTLPSFIAGYAMLKLKPWARTASIVAAVLETMSVPIGTAVGVYSFWFMFSEEGKAFYNKNSVYTQRPYALHDAPPPPPASEWNARTSQEREREYAPPPQPPDWRGE
ncbi:MAG: hypothetical protein LC747_00195 [Acidobacteria bacterium]|nr:hypothetical protein [Acidobacteriota bacterium]